MEIGLFQLENLATAFMPFALLDLRAERAPVHPEIDRVLVRAQVTTVDGARACLESLGVPKNIPVVLLSEDGSRARHLRPILEADGFEQIYVVEDGVEGLLKELEED